MSNKLLFPMRAEDAVVWQAGQSLQPIQLRRMQIQAETWEASTADRHSWRPPFWWSHRCPRRRRCCGCGWRISDCGRSSRHGRLFRQEEVAEAAEEIAHPKKKSLSRKSFRFHSFIHALISLIFRLGCGCGWRSSDCGCGWGWRGSNCSHSRRHGRCPCQEEVAQKVEGEVADPKKK